MEHQVTGNTLGIPSVRALRHVLYRNFLWYFGLTASLICFACLLLLFSGIYIYRSYTCMLVQRRKSVWEIDKCSVTPFPTIEGEPDFLSTNHSDYSWTSYDSYLFSHHLVTPHTPLCFPAQLRVVPHFHTCLPLSAHSSPSSRPNGQCTVTRLAVSKFWCGGYVRWEIQSERRWFTIAPSDWEGQKKLAILYARLSVILFHLPFYISFLLKNTIRCATLQWLVNLCTFLSSLGSRR